MQFDQFLVSVAHLQARPLGGLDAQFKLAPKMRLKYDAQKIKASNPKRAAVLALFYPSEQGETTFLLTQRASYNGTHSAQISFPGGKIETGDLTLLDTALRETQEEVGVDKTSVIPLREMTDVFIPPSNFLVTPFVGFTKARPNFITNEEVELLIEVTVTDLLDDANIDSVLMNTSYMKQVEVPCFRLHDHIVWGATGMMLSEIKEMLK
jgi:8-oxo-dGTP pyrophosphatase MutT (NUDIX family)